MLLFGHRFIASDSFYHISSIDCIKHTPPSSTVCLEFNEANLDIIEHVNANYVPLALRVANITELIYASNLNAKYAFVTPKMAKTAQNIAENYLFDMKIIVLIEEEEEIEELALLGVDGVAFANAIIKTNS
ncbi:MAG: hypothetical protein FP820_02980 [Sulfurimonas sp.]|nr:hypothetical protein [Sulfurimonas sp.]MBU3939767.1 hypothetical protein [bacterium]MBU4024218.1 hypothetical protein [bacterium]MBU4058644.1 hypothetical protein [bacterium]MBU4110787.1 hypothetical protein [bacterium]